MGVSRLPWNRTPIHMIYCDPSHTRIHNPTPTNQCFIYIPHTTQSNNSPSRPAGTHTIMPPSPVHHAAAMGRLGQVQAMLHEDPSLLNAIHRGREDASGDPSDWAGSTPLVLAARYNQVGLCAES